MSAVHAVIAVKGLQRGKHRLAGVLTDADRRRLIIAMLEDVLQAVRGSNIGPVHVLTQDLSLLPDDVHHLDDPGLGLNAAIAHAADWLTMHGAKSMLVLPADLPFVSADDIGALLEAAKDADAVLAPDSERMGTNALLLSPPKLIAPSFGPDSFAIHEQALRAAQARDVTVIDRPGLAHDIDLPRHLPALLEKPGGRYAFLRAALRRVS